MRVGVLLVGVVAACGEDLPDPPAKLVTLATIPFLSPQSPIGFDADNKLIVMDGNGIGLRRLNPPRLDVIPGTKAFSFGVMGVDQDGILLVGSFQTSTLARLPPTDILTMVGPAVNMTFRSPVGTPAGNYYVHVEFDNMTRKLVGALWEPSPLDLRRTLRAPDGTLYAIVDGDVVRLGAADAIEPITTCTDFGGSTCGDGQLVGVDADGHIALGDSGARGVPLFDPVAGTAREVRLPGELTVLSAVAGSRLIAVAATDPERNFDRSLWVLPAGGDEFFRIAALPNNGTEPRLVADRLGNTFMIDGDQLAELVPR